MCDDSCARCAYSSQIPVRRGSLFVPITIRVEGGANPNLDMWMALYGTYVDAEFIDPDTGPITHVMLEPCPGYDGVALKISTNGFRFEDGGYLHTDGEFATFPQDCVG